MHTRRIALIARAVLVAVGVAAVAACARGGNGGADERLSKAEFVEKGNAICAASNRQIAEIPPPSLADPVAVEQAVAQLVDIQRAALRDLRDLRPPARDQPGIREWLTEARRAVDQMDAIRRGLAEGDRGALTEAIDKGTALTASAEEFADAYGLDECSTTDDDDDSQ